MNRFIALNRYMNELDRVRARDGGRGPAGALSWGTAAAVTPRPGGRVPWARSLSAGQRVLVVLIENGGVDLYIPELVEGLLSSLPGSSLIPQSVKDSLVRAIRDGLRTATDNLLEGAELALNRYESARPDHYGDVVILRNGSAFYTSLRDTLVRLSREQKIIDLLVLTHGGRNSIALHNGTYVRGDDIRAIKTANGGQPLRLRSVYMMNCYASSLNAAWREIGAAVCGGASDINYFPEPTTYLFFSNWKSGASFSDSATRAYLGSVAALKGIIRGAATAIAGPVGGALAESLADLEHRDFVRGSAPVIAGDGSLTLTSDSVAFGSTLSLPSYRIVPVAHGLSGPPRTMTHGISPAGIAFIKSYEGFRANLYNDPAGHCTVGYGTLVHRGNCNGAASEAPYASGVTEARATELLMERVNDFQRLVNDAVTVEMEPHQYDALVSFAYNVGSGNFSSSTLLRKLNEGDYAAVPTELKKWVKAGGQTLPGLVRRRNAEAQMFASGTYSDNQSLYTRSFDQPRGIRNNNPGNLRISNQAWEGKIPVAENSDGAFEQFRSFEYGVRALILLLRNYLRSGRNTIARIVAAYAPPSDHNETDRYAAFLVQRLSQGGLAVTVNSELTIDRTTLRLLAQGIGRMENGQECISDEQFEAGFALLPADVRGAIAQSLWYAADLYQGLGEVADDNDVSEREETPISEGMDTTISPHCPLSAADDASSAHFRLSEFHSHDGTEVPRQLRGNIQALMNELEVLRAELGQPITVISGYRSPAQNAQVDGAPRSQHMCGTAADIKVKNHTPRQVYDTIERLIGQGLMRQGGLGVYSSFVHYDIRGTRARW